MNYYFYRNISNDLIPSLVLSFYITILISLLVVKIIGRWKVFEKADIPGWHSLIPLLNQYDIFEMGGIDGIYVLFEFIPLVGPIIYLVYQIKAYLEISKRFGHDTEYAILMIFFSPIMFIILGFGDDKYEINRSEVTSNNTNINSQVGLNTESDQNLNVTGNINISITPVKNNIPSTNEPVINEESNIQESRTKKYESK